MLGLVFLFACSRHRRNESEKPAAEQERDSSSDAPSPRGDVSGRQSTGPDLLVAPFDTETAKEQQQGWGDQLGVSEEITNSVGMKLALIPAGEFVMGSAQSPKEVCTAAHEPDDYAMYVANEHPQHRVRITKPFYLGVYEVTQEQYLRVMGMNPSWFSSGGGGRDQVLNMDTRRFPMENVSWVEAMEFCQKLSLLAQERLAGRVYRLPTEAEWEYACRAGTTTPYHFGSQLNGREANCHGDHPYATETGGPYRKRTRTCGSYPPNAFGLYDMHGNVCEWCQDLYQADYYRSSPIDDPQGPSGGSCPVLRGGCWNDSAVLCRSACRNRTLPEFRANSQGFRVAAVPPTRVPPR
jgi:formylglycine-generating enzyme required for sulfatase activity